MKKYVFAFAILFHLVGFAQSNEITPKIIEQVCKRSETAAFNSLATLFEQTNNFKNLTLEKVRNSYIDSMNAERDRLKSIANTENYQIILNSSDASFKYALCQKLNRPASSAILIASELYFLCRKTITTGKDHVPEPCF